MGIDAITLALAKKYTDGLAYTKTQRTEILAPVTFETAKTVEDGYGNSSTHLECESDFEVGLTYIVRFDGVEYELNCCATEELQAISLGNTAFWGVGLEDTGDVLLVGWTPSLGSRIFVATNLGIGEHEIAIYRKDEIVKQLDPKYYERIAWESPGEVTFEETAVNFDDGCFPEETTHILQDFIVGETYTVTIDGTYSYECVAFEFTEDGISFGCIGNPGIFGLGDLTDEPFFMLGYDKEPMGLFLKPSTFSTALGIAEPLTGIHTLSITHGSGEIHKVNPKFLPNTSDYEQNDPEAHDYIKNRPFYQYDETYSAIQAKAAGNASFEYNGMNYIKIHDYIPNGDLVYDMTLGMEGMNGVSNPVRYRLNVVTGDASDNYDWNISDMDMFYVFAYSEDTIAGGSAKAPEAGIYLNQYYTITIPVIKKLENSLVDVSYNDLDNKPFGDEADKVITCDDYSACFGGIKTIVATGEKIGFRRIHCELIALDDIIGAELILSDGTESIVTEDMVKTMSNDRYYWEIENLLLCTRGNIDNTEFGLEVSFVAGIYTSNRTGVYVKEIRLHPTVKKLDPKYLPGVYMPVVESGLTIAAGGERVLPETLTATLDAVAESKTPFVFGFLFDDLELRCVMNYNTYLGAPTWIGMFFYHQVFLIAVQKMDEGWLCTVITG